MKLDFEQRKRAISLEEEMESGELSNFAHELIWLRDLLTGSTIRKPDGWAYRYHSVGGMQGGSEIRFNSGEKVNGGLPIEAVAYWLETPPEKISSPRLPRSQTIHLRAANEAEPEGIEGTGEYGDE